MCGGRARGWGGAQRAASGRRGNPAPGSRENTARRWITALDGFPPNGRAVSSRSAPSTNAMLRLLLLLAGLRGCPAPRPGKPGAPPSLGAGRPLSCAPGAGSAASAGRGLAPRSLFARCPLEGAASGCGATREGDVTFTSPGTDLCAENLRSVSPCGCGLRVTKRTLCRENSSGTPGPRDPTTPTVSSCHLSQSHCPAWARVSWVLRPFMCRSRRAESNTSVCFGSSKGFLPVLKTASFSLVS